VQGLLKDIFNTSLHNLAGTAYSGNAVKYVNIIGTEWNAEHGYSGFIVLRHAVDASSCLALDGMEIPAPVFTRLRVRSLETTHFLLCTLVHSSSDPNYLLIVPF
jgi:hypothetical protein